MASYQAKLDEYCKILDMPKWYTGMSSIQEKTIYELADNLRDDFEQGTSFRVAKCLSELGLLPQISKNKVYTMIQLSRGNDLAFLFFLLEGYYKSCRINEAFSTNEKLLMMAIAKIDLLPTLRELDRILPPLQPSRMEITEVKHPKQLVQKHKQKKLSPQSKPKSPYFERLPRPNLVPTCLISRQPALVVKFPFWPLDGPPNYGKSTEKPWFSEYKLSPVNRLVKNTVCEALDKYFKDHASAIQMKAKIDLDNTPNMCLLHKYELEQMQLLKDELTVRARDRCLELLDLSMPAAKFRRDRILAQLEHDIAECMEKHSKEMRTDRTKVQTLSKGECVTHKEALVSIPWPPPQQREGRALVGSCLDLAHAAAHDTYTGKNLVGSFRKKMNFKNLEPDPPVPPPTEEIVSVAVPGMASTQAKPVKQKKKKGKKGTGKRKKGGGDCGSSRLDSDLDETLESCQPIVGLVNELCETRKKFRASFVVAGGKLKPKPKRRKPECEVRLVKRQTKKSFFQAAGDHKPYKFKYHRVFQSGQPKLYEMEKHLAKSFVKALDNSASDYAESTTRFITTEMESPDLEQHIKEEPESEASVTSESLDTSSNHSRRSHVDYKADVTEAVVRCAKQIWKRRLAYKLAQMDRSETLHSVHELNPSVLTYDQNHFDPDDAKLMDRLLADGMKELRKDQRYVLASLPDGHKLPVLREWIKRRYGKKYTGTEMRKALKEASMIFEIVSLMQNEAPKPDMMGMDSMAGKKKGYGYVDKAKALADKVKAAYYEKLNNVYMIQMNVCWYAMGNYMFPGGPPRKTFYSYMACKPEDIIRQSVWNGEHRNYKQLRDYHKKT